MEMNYSLSAHKSGGFLAICPDNSRSLCTVLGVVKNTAEALDIEEVASPGFARRVAKQGDCTRSDISDELEWIVNFIWLPGYTMQILYI